MEGQRYQVFVTIKQYDCHDIYAQTRAQARQEAIRRAMQTYAVLRSNVEVTAVNPKA